MSAGQDSRYRTLEQNVFGRSYGASVVDEYGTLVDSFRSVSAAEYAARLLNSGVARVDSHAIIGCKVVAA